MSRLRDLVAVELAKARRQTVTYVLAGILVGYGLLTVGAVALVLRLPQAGADADVLLAPLREDAFLFLGAALGSIAILLVVILASQSMGQEYSRGTLRTLVLAGVPRRHVPIAKLGVVAAAAVAGLALVLPLAAAGVWALSAAAGEDLAGLDARGLGHLVALLALPMLAWGWLAVCWTLLLRGTGAGMATSLAFLVAGDILAGLLASLGDLGLWVARALPNAAISGLGALSVSGSDWAWVAPNLVLWLGGSGWLALARLRRMDLLAATR